MRVFGLTMICVLGSLAQVLAASPTFSEYEFHEAVLFASDDQADSITYKRFCFGLSFMQEVSGDDSFLSLESSFKLLQDPWDLKGLEFGLQAYTEYNLKTDRFERSPFGVYAGLHFLRFFWTQVTFQGTYYNFEGNPHLVDSPEQGHVYLDSRDQEVLGDNWEFEVACLFRIHAPLVEIKQLTLGVYVQNESTMRFEELGLTLNRVEAGVSLRLFNFLWLRGGWRHEDYVHWADADHIFIAVHLLPF